MKKKDRERKRSRNGGELGNEKRGRKERRRCMEMECGGVWGGRADGLPIPEKMLSY